MSEKEAVIELAYKPRPYQLKLHQGLRRFNVFLMHRRFGKSVFAINHLIKQALTCPLPMPRFAYIGPTYQQTKMVMWDYLKSFTREIPNVSYNEAEMRCDFGHNGARIQLLSGENPDRLKGIYLDGAVLDEYASMSPTVWSEAVRPTLSDRKGWCIFIGTVKGENHFWELYQYAISGQSDEWYGANFKASETKVLPDSELASARATMSEADYAQEYENDARAGLVGAYFSKEITLAETEKRITSVPYDPMLSVDLYLDLGMNDATCIWYVQTSRTAHHIIDYTEVSGLSIPEISDLIKKKPFPIDQLVLPHDAEVRDLSTGKSRKQMFYQLGYRRVRVVPRVGKKTESINAARVILKKCYFDRIKCQQGLKALANYQKKWDSKNSVFQDSPLHNWASNGADAFQTFALGVREDTGMATIGGRSYRGGPLKAETEYDVYGGR